MSSRSVAYRGRLLTPLSDGGVRYLDDALLVIDEGHITSVSPWDRMPATMPGA